MTEPRGLAPHRRVLIAHGISRTGDWMMGTALPLAVYQETGSPVVVSVLFAASAISYLAGPVIGAWLDHHDRLRSMRAANLLAAVAMVAMAVVAETGALPVGAVGLTLVESWFAQVAFVGTLAVAPLLAVPARRARVQASLVGVDPLAHVVGPILGAWTYATFGITASILVNAASYVASALILASVPDDAVDPLSTGGGADEVAPAGARRRGLPTPLRALLVITVLAMAGQGAFSAMLVPFLTDQVGMSTAGVGRAMAVVALGAVVGVVTNRVLLDKRPFSALLAAPLAGAGALTLLTASASFGGSSTPVVVVLALVAMGAVPVIGGLGGHKIVLALCDPRDFGRVHGTIGCAVAVGLIIGALASGPLAQATSTTAALVLSGNLSLVAALVAGDGQRRWGHEIGEEEARWGTTTAPLSPS